MKYTAKYTAREIIFGICHPWVLLSREPDISKLAPDPVKQFESWYALMRRCFWIQFPNAMCLSTLDPNSFPNGRMVLLKNTDARGFVFYTNYDSVKGQSLTAAPKAALTFYWETIQRQVRVQGTVERTSEEESDAYFATRPRESQLSAWASLQSEELPSRKALTERMREFRETFLGRQVPRPPHWGGFRVVPERVEFMLLRAGRLHERVVYKKDADARWTISRLYP